MNLEEKKELLQSMAEVLKGSKIEQMIMIADEGRRGNLSLRREK